MKLPDRVYYTKEHEWIEFVDGIAFVGITDFAQRELGDIVSIAIESVGQTLNQNDVYGTVEAVKTVSDLFFPINGEILEVNQLINESPDIINVDPYNEGWIVKVKPENYRSRENLLLREAYQSLIGLKTRRNHETNASNF